MALTIITTRSENGNKFLCRDCIRSFCSGTHTQEEIICSMTKQPVPFPVTSCTHFFDKTFNQDMVPVEAMKKSAWEMVVYKGVLTFRPPLGRLRMRRRRRNPYAKSISNPNPNPLVN